MSVVKVKRRRRRGKGARTALINRNGEGDLGADAASVLAEEDVGVLAGDESLRGWSRETGDGEAKGKEGGGGLHGCLVWCASG
jgi:hypothetical protein